MISRIGKNWGKADRARGVLGKKKPNQGGEIARGITPPLK